MLLAISHWIETVEKSSKREQTSSPLTLVSLKQIQLGTGYIYRYASAFLFLSLASLQFHIYGELTEEINFYPYLYGIHIPCLFLIGPFSYIYFEEMSGGGFYKIRILHFLPSVLSLLYIYLIRPADYRLPPMGLHTLGHNSEFEYSIQLLLSFGVISIFTYTISIFFRVWQWKYGSKDKLEFSFWPFLWLLVYSLSVVTLFVLSQLFFMQMFILACLGLTSLLSFILLFKMNHRELIPNFKTETRLARYRESRIKGVNVPQILQRLDDLMNLEQLYLNEDLSLPILSKRLDLHTHQLSEILNFHLRCTFRNYVNQFRLQEAARLLLERPDMTILSIIYASGFNSKSSFHKLFQDRFGLSPQNYRLQSK
ncbi:DNA-binding helix-turn-helix protein [Leptospira wolbachii serovar Codice str. CDC]|uniref:DNA-binding helix-turn-helix protein n=1 Tax=Leptospira wolbachii serovar Codice str. CDC TaxID=1218599 RepID=R9A8F5_9LEPT|nr:DNA-binding helix-turn-helix protein [Leptospira wolbachii serovar Codice str. CDC]